MSGQLQIIIGPMFSGKTSMMMTVVERSHRAKKKCLIITHAIDQRFNATDCIVTHAGFTHASVPTLLTASLESEQVARAVKDCAVIGIDEIQFFGRDNAAVRATMRVIEEWLLSGKMVVCAGLDTDWRREPFPILAPLVGHASIVTKLLAVCATCGEDAPFSARLTTLGDDAFVNPVGSDEKYRGVCRRCYLRMHPPGSEPAAS